ncbi:Condensin-2 complex subunit H2 [Phytophthora cinnamomi]|uniref:Condensin-2 complex subunit H2 n=1 Tax=Phytophthora cinnamomi TaxID=4785 RepID=UPI00355A107E|nr:Condensin-2 complex subunit H2 [Phytophthora cinnamomi]
MSEGRLQHLLQPIRDLSKNWNIDLASELEEYMDKLEHLSIAFDPEDGASIGDAEAGVMNFAEAALLIQGTSVIYSRKVEYLHALVYQTLAHLSKQQDDKQQGQRQQDADAEQVGDEEEEDAGAGVFNNPLPLYDELEEAKETHIALKRAKQEDEETESDRRRKRKEAAALNRSKNNIQASIALMGSLVPDERDHGETFKLLSCNLHASGVLLLDEASKKYLGAKQRAAGDQPLAFGETPGRQGGMWVAADGENPSMALNFDDMDANEDEDANDNAFDEQPDYEFDGGEQMQEDPVDGVANGEQQEEMPNEEPSRPTTRSMTALPVGEKDPWAPLDAYDASTSVARPFKKGRSYPRVPAYKKKKAGQAALSNKEGAVGMDDDAEQDGLSDPAFQDRFFMGSNGPQWASWVWTETGSENSLEKMCKRTFCRAPLLVKSCDALWQREAKWRSIMRRCEAREKQSAQAMLLREQAMEEEETDGNDHMQALTLSTATARLDMAFRNDANGNNDEEENNADDNDYDDGFDGGDWDQGNDMDDPMGSYEAAAAAAAGSDGGPLTYEEICRQHLASFMSGTEKYVRETDLSKQVSDWQEKLTPLLKQQDAHPPFDIHHYGRAIMERLAEEKKNSSLNKHSKTTKRDKNKRARLEPVSEDVEERETVPFETLVGGKSQFEVCRLFLASLQLANTGNVALSHAHTTADHGRVPFEMQLLSTTNAYETLQA